MKQNIKTKVITENKQTYKIKRKLKMNKICLKIKVKFQTWIKPLFCTNFMFDISFTCNIKLQNKKLNILIMTVEEMYVKISLQDSFKLIVL